MLDPRRLPRLFVATLFRTPFTDKIRHSKARLMVRRITYGSVASPGIRPSSQSRFCCTPLAAPTFGCKAIFPSHGLHFSVACSSWRHTSVKWHCHAQDPWFGAITFSSQSLRMENLHCLRMTRLNVRGRQDMTKCTFCPPGGRRFHKPFCFANSGLGCLGLYFVLGTRERISISLLSAEGVA